MEEGTQPGIDKPIFRLKRLRDALTLIDKPVGQLVEYLQNFDWLNYIDQFFKLELTRIYSLSVF